MSDQIKEYILAAKKSGKTDSQVKQDLLGVGWHNEQIAPYFGEVVTKDPGIFEFIGQCWQVVVKIWWKLFVIQTIPLLLNLVLIIVGALIIGILYTILSTNNVNTLWVYGAISALVFVMIFTMTWLMTWGSVATLIGANPHNINLSRKEIFDKAKKLVWKNLALVSVLSLLVIGNSIWLGIPAIIFAFFTSLAMVAQVNEGLATTEAMRMSRELLRGRKWMFLKYTLSLSGLAFLLSLTIGMVLKSLGLSENIADLFSSIPSAFYGYLSLVATQKLYFMLKSKMGDVPLPKKQSVLVYSGWAGVIVLIALSIFMMTLLPKLLMNIQVPNNINLPIPSGIYEAV